MNMSRVDRFTGDLGIEGTSDVIEFVGSSSVIGHQMLQFDQVSPESSAHVFALGIEMIY